MRVFSRITFCYLQENPPSLRMNALEHLVLHTVSLSFYGEIMENSSKELSRKEIWKMFDAISTTYDKVNLILSFGIDRVWRKTLAEHLPKESSLDVLDCATGTGDQLFSILQKNPSWKGIGIDLSQEMLEIAKKKNVKKGLEMKANFQVASALDLPFPDDSFAAVTISFGIRNVENVVEALTEMRRVLLPGGTILILEFSLPKNPILRFFHSFYLKKVLPFVGGVFSKNKEAYTYLQKTIDSFPYGKSFCDLLFKAGFQQVKDYPLSGGIATLYEGRK